MPRAKAPPESTSVTGPSRGTPASARAVSVPPAPPPTMTTPSVMRSPRAGTELYAGSTGTSHPRGSGRRDPKSSVRVR